VPQLRKAVVPLNNRNEHFVIGALYHGSNRVFEEGKMIKPGSAVRKSGWKTAFATYDKTIAEDHAALQAANYGGKPAVYEVEPIKDVEPHPDVNYTVTSKTGFRVVRRAD
jgi:hypothetical protein